MKGDRTKEPFINLDQITVRLRDKWYLEGTSWQIHRREQWVLLGPNGSGKSTLVKAILGMVPVVRGRITYHGNSSPSRSVYERFSYVSTEQHRDLIKRENLKDACRDFSGGTDFTSVRDLLSSSPGGVPLQLPVSLMSGFLQIDHLMERPVRALSAGELRKTLIARSLMNRPELLILDEPFEGLDEVARRDLAGMIEELVSQGLQIILITHRREEIIDCMTHVLCLEDGRVRSGGTRQEVLGEMALSSHGLGPGDAVHQDIPSFQRDAARPFAGRLSWLHGGVSIEDSPVLIRMKDVTVRYGNIVALKGFNWTVREGENWALVGPNGAGKTTVLNLILGRNLQSYANEIHLFGKKKGSGEGLWELKRHMGFVSSDLNASYQQGIKAFDVVCSGFFDSVGLYHRCDEGKLLTAKRWMQALGLNETGRRPFDRLSQGQRQMVLLARALVKSPRLLILDEPCSGLDPVNRRQLQRVVDFIGRHTHTTILYVTHHVREILPCITHLMRLEGGKTIECKPLHGSDGGKGGEGTLPLAVQGSEAC